MIYTKDGINFYEGDMQVGDREATALEISDYEAKKAIDEAALLAQQTKQAALDTLTVITASEKIFYADLASRVDLAAAIDSAALTGVTSTLWKLADKNIVTVTLDEIREANKLALEAKGSLVLV